MKIDTVVTTIGAELTEEKKSQILTIIRDKWDVFDTKCDLADHLEQGFIFGLYGNEHHLLSEYMVLIDQVEVEKTPIVVEDIPIDPIIESIQNEGI